MATEKTAKKSAAKKAPAKKIAAKAAPVKKVVAKKSPAKKAAAKKTPSPKVTVKTAPDVKVLAPMRKPVSVSRDLLTGKIARNKHFNAKQLKDQLDRLLILRERISGEILSISRDTLNQSERDPSLSDQGTDTFDREFALNQLSNEQDVLFEIDEAIRRIQDGTYGVCEMKELPINFERLQALPYVRYSVAAQAELEKGRMTYRPFGSIYRD